MDEALIRKQEEELQHTGRYYKHICFLCVPLLFVSCYLYGLRPLLLCGFALLMATCATGSSRCCAAASTGPGTIPTRALPSSSPC